MSHTKPLNGDLKGMPVGSSIDGDPILDGVRRSLAEGMSGNDGIFEIMRSSAATTASGKQIMDALIGMAARGSRRGPVTVSRGGTPSSAGTIGLAVGAVGLAAGVAGGLAAGASKSSYVKPGVGTRPVAGAATTPAISKPALTPPPGGNPNVPEPPKSAPVITSTSTPKSAFTASKTKLSSVPPPAPPSPPPMTLAPTTVKAPLASMLPASFGLPLASSSTSSTSTSTGTPVTPLYSALGITPKGPQVIYPDGTSAPLSSLPPAK